MRKRRDDYCEVRGCRRQRYRAGLCAGHRWRKQEGKEPWDAPLRIHRGDGRKTRSVGAIRADLVDWLDAVAESHHTSRALLLEGLIERSREREAA